MKREEVRGQARVEIETMIRVQHRRNFKQPNGGWPERVVEIHKQAAASRGDWLTACGLTRLPPGHDLAWFWSRVACARCLITHPPSRRLAALLTARVAAEAEAKEEKNRVRHAAMMVPGSPEWERAEREALRRQRRHKAPELSARERMELEDEARVPDEFLEDRPAR